MDQNQDTPDHQREATEGEQDAFLSSAKQGSPLHHSLGAKFTAIGFILLILVGNIWLALAVFHMELPQWLELFFILGLAMIILGGLGMLISFIKQKLADH